MPRKRNFLKASSATNVAYPSAGKAEAENGGFFFKGKADAQIRELLIVKPPIVPTCGNPGTPKGCGRFITRL
jgi:hypothetical protein